MNSSRSFSAKSTGTTAPDYAASPSDYTDYVRATQQGSGVPRRSTASTSSTMASTASKKSSRCAKTNANSYCGRHTDEFLFDGLGDFGKGIWRKVTSKNQ